MKRPYQGKRLQKKDEPDVYQHLPYTRGEYGERGPVPREELARRGSPAYGTQPPQRAQNRLERFIEDNSDDVRAEFSDAVHMTPRKRKWIIVLALLLLVVGGAAVALGMWIRPPDVAGRDPVKPSTGIALPSDDETWVDDGYTGDLPEVSGERKEGVYTFLLVGTDKGDGNTDTIMVASYDTKNQKLNVMSIPRDTMINAPWDIKKINSVYSRYSDGIGALSKQVKNIIGFAPDFYLKVDLAAFVELVDLIGGVTFNVPRDMNYDDPYQDLHIHLDAGEQLLGGEDAMGLIRWRKNNDGTGYPEGDIGRVRMQQDFLKALIKDCVAIKNWPKIKSYVNIAAEYVVSDLSVGEMIWFAGKALELDMNNINTCTLPGNYGASAWSRAVGSFQSYVTVYPNQLVTLVNESFNPYIAPVTTSMMDIMYINADKSISSSTGVLRDSKANDWLLEEEEEDEGSETTGEGTGEGTDAPPAGTTGDVTGSGTDTPTTGTDLPPAGTDTPPAGTDIPPEQPDPGVPPADSSGEIPPPAVEPSGPIQNPMQLPPEAFEQNGTPDWLF